MSRCPQCQRPLPLAAAEGLCPGCLLAAALADDFSSPGSTSNDPLAFGPGEAADSAWSLPVTALQSFGDYRNLRLLARGGMGVVYEATAPTPAERGLPSPQRDESSTHVGTFEPRGQPAPLRVENPRSDPPASVSSGRQVALKMILAGRFARDEDLRRFRAEAEAVANLDHPNIVPIYDVGEHDGIAFFTMKLIAGGSLARQLTAQRASTSASARHAAGLLAKIARAVHHAHQHGVLHRDLKPANILIDPQGEPHITDFGLAKVLGRETQLTLSDAILGTPAYMSPEQATGRTREVTLATDVYSLGAILYELLTGQPPFAGGTAYEIIQQVIEQPPKRPSAINAEVNRDLEILCLKCLEKDPARRYRSAELLADDLERWLRNEPIQARPSAAFEVMIKWTRRHRMAAALIATVLLALTSITIVSTVLGWRVAAEAEKNRRQIIQLNVAEGNRLAASGDSALALLHFLHALQLEPNNLSSQDAHRRRLTAALDHGPALEQLWSHHGAANMATFSPDGQLLASVGDDGVAHLWKVTNGLAASPPLTHPAAVSTVTFSPDGRRLATTCANGTAWIWDVRTGQRLAGPFPENEPQFKRIGTPGVAFSPDGTLVISSAGPAAQIRNAENGHALGPPLPLPHRIQHATFSPDGRQVLLVDENGHARLFDAQTYQSLLPPWRLASDSPSPWSGGWFRPDGQVVLIARHSGEARLWSTANGEPVSPVLRHNSSVPLNHGGFSPDGRFAFTVGLDARVRLWDSVSGTAFGAQPESEPPLLQEGFSVDQRSIVLPILNDIVHVRRVGDGAPIAPALHHGAFVFSAEFSPDRRHIATADQSGIVRLWRCQREAALHTLTEESPIVTAEFNPAADAILTTTTAGAVTLWDVRTTLRHERLQSSGPEILHASLDPAGTSVAIGSRDRTARIYDLKTRREMFAPLPHEADVRHVAFSPDGRKLLTITQSSDPQRSVARIWDVSSGAAMLGPIPHPDWLDWCEFSPDGSRFLTACADGYVRVFSSASGQPLGQPMKAGSYIWEAHFSPDGTHLAAANADYTYNARAGSLFEVSSGRTEATFAGHRDGVSQIVFSPDGRLAATGSEDATARVWDAHTGRAIGPALPHSGKITRVQFSPDSRYLATASQDGTARVWEAATGEPITPPLVHTRTVRVVRFRADGHQLLTAGNDGRARIWNLAPARIPLEELTAISALRSAHQLDRSGAVTPATAETLRQLWSSPDTKP